LSLAQAEHRLEGDVEQIEAPGEGAERRQHAARAIADEAAAADRTAAPCDSGDRMKVSGDLSDDRAGGGLVAKQDGLQRELRCRLAAEAGRQKLIVVAGDPDPVPPKLQAADRAAIVRAHAFARCAIMERIAKGHDAARFIKCDQPGGRRERRGGVIRRQKDAARGECGAFLGVQIGDAEKALFSQNSAPAGLAQKSTPKTFSRPPGRSVV